MKKEEILTRAEATKLMAKLSRTERFPQDKPDIEALATTLMEAAPGVLLARKTVEELRRTCTFCPSDAQIFATAQRLDAPDLTKWEPMKPCPLGKCDGGGYVFVEKDGTSGAERCGCKSVPRPSVLTEREAVK